jgi:hypothetical protein
VEGNFSLFLYCDWNRRPEYAATELSCFVHRDSDEGGSESILSVGVICLFSKSAKRSAELQGFPTVVF